MSHKIESSFGVNYYNKVNIVIDTNLTLSAEDAKTIQAAINTINQVAERYFKEVETSEGDK